MVSSSHVEDSKKELVRDVPRLDLMGAQLADFKKGGFMVHNGS